MESENKDKFDDTIDYRQELENYRKEVEKIKLSPLKLFLAECEDLGDKNLIVKN